MDNRTWNTHAEVSAIAATGAKSNLRSMTDFLACRFSCNGLPPVSHGLSATNCSPISIEGALFAKFTTKFHNDEVTSRCSMVHVSSSVQAMYLSTTCYSTLASSPRTFHHTRRQTSLRRGATPDTNTVDTNRKPPHINAVWSINDGYTTTSDPHDITCSCPQRDATPSHPSELPFPCTQENNRQMDAWLQIYASSTFNTCLHWALSSMDGPPIEIHIEPTATPKACHTLAPLHWQQ